MLPFAGERKREKTAQTRPAVSQREVWKEKKKRLNSTSHRHTWKKKVAQNTAHERKQKKKAALAKAIDHPLLLSADMRFGRQPCSYFEQVPRRKTAVSLSLSFRVSKLRCKLSRHSWLIRRGIRFEQIKNARRRKKKKRTYQLREKKFKKGEKETHNVHLPSLQPTWDGEKKKNKKKTIR